MKIMAKQNDINDLLQIFR